MDQGGTRQVVPDRIVLASLVSSEGTRSNVGSHRYDLERQCSCVDRNPTIEALTECKAVSLTSCFSMFISGYRQFHIVRRTLPGFTNPDCHQLQEHLKYSQYDSFRVDFRRGVFLSLQLQEHSKYCQDDSLRLDHRSSLFVSIYDSRRREMVRGLCEDPYRH